MRIKIASIVLVLAITCCLQPARPGQASTAEEARAHKFALALFHFNIQYVAGGLVGIIPDPLAFLIPGWELDAEGVEDRIVTESFEPILDLMLDHPDWGIDIELQAYMIEVLADRHPGVIEKLRTLAHTGGVELVCFHYSDQLFLAYPRVDWERSVALAREVFERHDLPLSKVVFCQEGQAGPGLAGAMADHGYDVMVWPKNLYTYQHGDFEAEPIYSFGDIDLIFAPKDVNYGGGLVQVRWTFLDDGELLATGDMDPYFTPFFYYKPQHVCDYEERLQALADDGFEIATVSRYVEAVRSLGVPHADPGPLLDGTWQPQSTDGTSRWMGGVGLWQAQELDNDVRTICSLAHREVLAAETIVEACRDRGACASELGPAVAEAWRILALAEVTDATGINPFRGEIEYGISHAAEALRLAREVIVRAREALGYEQVAIDTRMGQVGPGEPPPPPPTSEPAYPMWIRCGTRTHSSAWQRISDQPRIDRVEITFFPGPGTGGRNLDVTFPGWGDEFIYTPALADGSPARYMRSSFVWDHYYLALPDGMINLGPRQFVIKDTARVHVAAKIFAGNGRVSFADETACPDDTITWVFYLVRGALADAADLADRVNLRPTLYR